MNSRIPLLYLEIEVNMSMSAFGITLPELLATLTGLCFQPAPTLANIPVEEETQLISRARR